MAMVNRAVILDTMAKIIERREQKKLVLTDEIKLANIGFRSLDFSELAIRVEQAAGCMLNFDAAPLRSITTVKDVVEFFTAIQNASSSK
ncbi:MAG: acyl carrier protein [bacterium]|nr:acyl carrier protein [bacterium]